jgi:hypothetical protein
MEWDWLEVPGTRVTLTISSTSYVRWESETMMRRRKQRKWHSADDDPSSGHINLVDVWLVFSVVLLIALIASGAVRQRARPDETQTTTVLDSQGNLEIIERKGIEVDRMRVTQESLSGTGERLGTAYRLKSGEVLYVPETRQSPEAE